MTLVYTYDDWFDKFEPIKNDMAGYDQHTFETYGAELEFVQAQDNTHVWTEVDGDEGTYIITGMHWVNRIHYYVTKQPWTDENTEIPTWAYRDCDCMTEENDYEYDPDCDKCDEGSINLDVDTIEDLKIIYKGMDVTFAN